MLCEQELSEFFNHIDELSQASQDSNVVDHFQNVNRLQDENTRLKEKLKKVFGSTREVLDIVKNETYLKEEALKELEETKRKVKSIEDSFEDLQKESINKQFSWKEKFDELEYRNQELSKCHVELSLDYLEVLSETTISYCFELNRARNKIATKTENFLREILGDKFLKPQIMSRRGKAEKKKRSSKAIPKEEVAKDKPSNRKRKKMENFDMQSISQVSSPSSFFEEENVSEIGSDYTFNTFSIGNETSYSLTQINSTKRQKVTKSPTTICKCHEEGLKLVSIGVDTEDLVQLPMPSVISLLEEDDYDDVPVEIDNEPIYCEPETTSKKNRVEIIAIENLTTPKETSTTSTNTEEEVIVEKCNKSTSTVHSSTTRGTSTPQISTKSCGVQYPEINLEKIFIETIFELPDCLSPIRDLERLIDETEEETANIKEPSVTQQTQTNLLNVSREIDYVSKSFTEEQSFNQLGKTVFNLFLERLRKSNKTVENDDAHTRELLWEYMQQQFFDRYNEFTFDDYFSTSLISDYNGANSSKERKSTNIIQEKEDFGVIVQQEKKFQLKPQESSSESEEEITHLSNEDHSKELFDILDIIRTQCPTPPLLIEPIADIPDELLITINSQQESPREIQDIFGEFSSDDKIVTEERSSVSSPATICDDRSSSPLSICDDFSENDEESSDENSSNIDLDEFDSPLSPPMEDRGDDIYLESPASPPSFGHHEASPPYDPIEIPWDSPNSHLAASLDEKTNPLDYHHQIRLNLVQWQHRQTISNLKQDKIFCKMRKSIKIYLDAEWISENLELCLKQLEGKSQLFLKEAIFETVEDNEMQNEISTQFTPPAPPLPHYQQKLILLIKRLADKHPMLPHVLMQDLEMKLFKCENVILEVAYLRNLCYYYTSLVDLFFDGDTTMVFYFIVKCIYFYNYKAIPMIFVLIKAFPRALPKKCALLKKNSPNIDWENMSGLEVSKVRLDLEWVDSLDLTVFYLLTSIQMYRRKGHESYAFHDHELFNYLPKYYGFAQSFITAPKLLDILVKRFVDGDLTNLSLSFILLAKRMNVDFTIRTLLKEKLLPMLNKFIHEITDNVEQKKIDQICLLVEVVSSILKTFADEKEKSFKEIFPLIINILGRAEKSQQLQEQCIRAILRLHRFIDNHKEIYDILVHQYEKRNSFSKSLQYSIVTFIHRKNENYFKKA